MSKNKKRKEKKMQTVIVVLLCLVMIFAGLSVGLIVSQLLHPTTDSPKTDTLFDIRSNDTADKEEFSDNTIIPCWDTIKMTANQTIQSVNFYNPERNKGIYFQLVLTLEDGTELYSSQTIPPGKALYEITLEKELAPGTYNATLQYNCSTSTGKELNGSNLKFTLVMEDKTNE